MQKIFDTYCRLLDMLMAFLLCAMTVMVFSNVVLRYVFDSGITLSEELSRWFLVWMTFLGAVVALNHGGHLQTDAIVSLLPKIIKKIVGLIANALMLYVSWLLLDGSLIQFKIDLNTTAPAVGLPIACIDAAGVVFCVSSMLFIVRNIVVIFSGNSTEKPKEK